MKSFLSLILYSIGIVSLVRGRALWEECLMIDERSVFADSVPHADTRCNVSSLAACHQLCQGRTYAGCNAYSYFRPGGFCRLYAAADRRSPPAKVESDLDVTTVRLRARCFDVAAAAAESRFRIKRSGTGMDMGMGTGTGTGMTATTGGSAVVAPDDGGGSIDVTFEPEPVGPTGAPAVVPGPSAAPIAPPPFYTGVTPPPAKPTVPAVGPGPQPQPQPQPQPPAGAVVQPPQQQQQQQPQPSGKRLGKWSIEQLRQTDGIIPLQNGTNRFASQRGMTGFGTPRNTDTKVRAENLQLLPEEIARLSDLEVRPQSGTNKFATQRGMVGFGTGRDVCRESDKVNVLPGDLQPVPEEKNRMTDGIVRLQSGTNRYATQKGMTGIGTNRRETTKMLDTKHPEGDVEHPDQSNIPLQSGTNKFASQRGMTGFGTSRRETTKMLDTKHPEQIIDHPDQTIIPLQMGTNRFASQQGMTGMGAFRLETMNPLISRQSKDSQGIIPSQMGSNQFASQHGMTLFGTPRDVNFVESGELPFEEIKKSESIIPSQAGWNQGDSQRGMTGFGAPRDVKGKHLKRLWEIEFPEETLGHL